MLHFDTTTNGLRQARLGALSARYGRRGTLTLGARRLALAGARSWRRGDAVLRRTTDVLAASAALLATAPVSAGLLVAAAVSGRPFGRDVRVGLHGRTLVCPAWPAFAGALGRLARRPAFRIAPRLVQVVRGELALVGPRAAAPGAFVSAGHRGRRRIDMTPGLVCLHWLRARTNIAFSSEIDADLEYCDTASWTGDLFLLARACVSPIYGGMAARTATQVSMLGLRIDNATMDEAIAAIVDRVSAPDGSAQVSFVNAHCANVARRDETYRRALGGSALVFADGIGMKIAGALLRRPIAENVNGTDMLPRLCARLAGRRVFLLGGTPGTADAAAAWICTRFPDIAVAGTHHGFFDADRDAEVAATIRAAGTELLLVAFGVPRQETWIAAQLEASGARVAMGVGGLFDFYAGRIPRAPQWMRELALEWVFRLYQEPRRMWRRYVLGNLIFLYHVVAERIGGAAERI